MERHYGIVNGAVNGIVNGIVKGIIRGIGTNLGNVVENEPARRAGTRAFYALGYDQPCHHARPEGSL